MPKKKSTKNKKSQAAQAAEAAAGTRDVTVHNTDNTINLVNCQGIQIGDANVLNLAEGVDRPTERPRKQDGNGGESREQLGVLFLVEVLERFERPIPYEELEEQVTTKLELSKGKSFRDLSGWYLQDFLIKHRDTFDVFKRRHVKSVRLKKKARKLTVDSIVHTSEELKGASESIKVAGKETIDSTESDLSDEDQTLEGEWVKVEKKKGNLRGKGKATDTDESKLIELKTLCNFDESKFQKIIQNDECDDVVYVADIDIYKNNPLLFSQHIVSMWNTPQRVQSHIIVGIDSGNFKGISDPVDDLTCQNLFQKSYFSTKPVYSCYTAYHQGKLFGVIEIESSCGFGLPSAAKLRTEVPALVSDIGDIWIRQGKHFVTIKTTDNEIGLVYTWFLGKFPERSDTDLTQNSREINESRKVATDVDTAKHNERSDDETDSTFANFWNSIKGFKKGHFVLLAGDVSNTITNLEAFALIPWIAVYDFDIYSSSNGILNIVQEKLDKARHLKLRTWKEPVDSISENGTWWCSVRGREELADSRTDLRNGEVEDTNVWIKTVKSSLDNNCDSLERFANDYTVLTVLILWPKTEKLIPFLHKTLDKLTESLSCTPNIVVCIDKPPATLFSQTRLQILREEFHTNIDVYVMDLEHICHGIVQNMSSSKDKDALQYNLPTIEGHKSSAINESDAAWLRTDFEVLYLDNPYTKGSADEQAVEEEISTFYKGGNLHWFAWYEGKSKVGQIAIKRAKMKTLEEKIRPHLDEFRTTVITLFHAPGSGGTTLAQAIIWKFHQTLPSIHMKLRTGSASDELVKKVAFLYDKTGLPVLILVDGEEDSKVRHLSKRLKYAIILYVKRHPYPAPREDTGDKVFLPGFVTPEEAGRLADKFGENVEPSKKKALDKLKTDVCTNSSDHYMFEFGMTVHLHEFKGIVSYVSGYLQLDDTSSNTNLPMWQRCLGYLALVYFYGQTSVPCQFFAALFGKPANYNMSLEEDFPYPIKEFVVYDKNESKKNNLRICHYIVAKEILEQLLTRRAKSLSTERSESLSLAACRNLSKFCIEFIEYVSRKKSKNSALSSTMMFVLTKTFIFRDEKDVSENENEENTRRRPVLSKIMSDIPGGKPLFTERLSVLQKLSSSFPEDPNFCAHLGRFYAFCRTDDEAEAEKCFKKAIHLCEKKSQKKSLDDVDDGIKLSLSHIYHMYGMVKQRNVSKNIKNAPHVGHSCEGEIFLEHLSDMVPIAEEACDLFKQSRDITPATRDVYLFAYTGEIQVRLKVCEFVIRHYDRGHGSISIFLKSGADIESKTFVRNSISAVENLLYECYFDVELVGDDLRTLRKLVSWYNRLFQKQELPLLLMSSNDPVSERRLQITATKMKYGNNNTLAGIENIDNEHAINEIVQLYEENFSDVHNSGAQSGYCKKELEREYRDWIFAIRHENFTKNYPLEQVLGYVEKWHELLRSPLSTFYLFVLRSLLGFGTEDIAGKTECLVEALALKVELSKLTDLIIRPKYPREWLGATGDGIKRLVPGKRHVGIYGEESNDSSVGQSQYALCRGTIAFPNSGKLGGMIDFKVGINSVKVFYIPKRANLEGKRYIGRQVEFQLGFSIELGFEAYHVKLMKRYGCSCNAKLWFTSADTCLTCKCGYSVYKDDLNEVK